MPTEANRGPVEAWKGLKERGLQEEMAVEAHRLLVQLRLTSLFLYAVTVEHLITSIKSEVDDFQ